MRLLDIAPVQLDLKLFQTGLNITINKITKSASLLASARALNRKFGIKNRQFIEA
jgi:hypothetical protein